MDHHPLPRPEDESVFDRITSWILFLFLLPWRFLAVAWIVLMIIPGLVLFSRLPTLASRHKAEPCLLYLRAINRERAATPLAHLGYRPTVEKHLVNLKLGEDHRYLLLNYYSLSLYRTNATSVTQGKSVNGEPVYLIQYSNGSTRQVGFTTPHANIPAEELAKARRGIAACFPSKKAEAAVREWGESLFWTEWLAAHELREVPYDQIPAPKGGTAQEQLWLAWTVLSGGNPAAEKELPLLPKRFEQAFPQPADREAALAWAKGMYDRMEANYLGYQTCVQKLFTYKPNARTSSEFIIVDGKRVLPPRTNWTYIWLIDRHFGLGDASRAAALAHWQGCFPAERHDKVVEFGNKVLEERRAEGEALPPVPELLPWVCTVERLIGSDPCGSRHRALLDAEFGEEQFGRVRGAVRTTNPNDDFFYLLASDDRLGLYPEGTSGTTWEGKGYRLGISVFDIAATMLGISTILTLLSRFLIGGASKELWREHCEGRGKEPWYLWVLGVLSAAALGAWFAPFTLDDSMVLFTGGYLERFLAATVATVVGGVLIGTCRRILALGLVILGVDVERTWLDEVLGILLGGLILHYFGAGLLNIALFVLADLIPALLQSCLTRSRPRVEESPCLTPVPFRWNEVGAPSKS